MIFSGQADTVVTPPYTTGLYNSLPAMTKSVYLEVSNADHGFMVGRPNPVMIRTMLPFVKIFLDNDARYSRFLCPLSDSCGVVIYRSTCPLLPPGPTPTPSMPGPPLRPPAHPTPPTGGYSSTPASPTAPSALSNPDVT
jgi:hypothetical protein